MSGSPWDGEPTDTSDADRISALVSLCLLEHVREFKRPPEVSDAAALYAQLVELAGSERDAASLLGSGAAEMFVSLGEQGGFDAEQALQNGLSSRPGPV